MKLLTVVGARPQFVKAAAVSRALQRASDIREILVHTGQHYDYGMSHVFFEELNIPEPEYNLGIGAGTHGRQTGRMLESIESVILQERPDWVLVYGDTNSTLAGVLAASKLHTCVGHVEAGLRSFNRSMPEETNRIVTDHLSDLLFAPTQNAVQRLATEGISGRNVHLVGDVMYDAALFCAEIAKDRSQVLDLLDVKSRCYYLATVHRAENTDNPDRLTGIITGLIGLAERFPVVLPLHPRTEKALQALGILEEAKRAIKFVEPVGYLDMIVLEKNARAIVTDSGGIQKEAFFYRRPCITLRDETEWTELVEHGFNQLVGASPERLLNAAEATEEANLDWDHPLYGIGEAANEIVRILSAVHGGGLDAGLREKH